MIFEYEFVPVKVCDEITLGIYKLVKFKNLYMVILMITHLSTSRLRLVHDIQEFLYQNICFSYRNSSLSPLRCRLVERVMCLIRY